MKSVQSDAPGSGRVKLRAIGFGVAVFVVTLLAYWPAVHAEFIWNDSDYVTSPQLQSLHGLWRIWTEVGATEQYYPLLHSAFWVEHRLWGDSPTGYHLVNILLHAGAACLFAAVLSRVLVPDRSRSTTMPTGRSLPAGDEMRDESPASRLLSPGKSGPAPSRIGLADASTIGPERIAWLAAFLFALHPVCVESVAWISEQKNTLSLVFYLAAAIGFLRFADTAGGALAAQPTKQSESRVGEKGEELRRKAKRAYRWATFVFVCALLSKTTTATLPAALLVVTWWRRGRLDWRRDWRPLIPWFVLGAVMGLFSAWVEKHYIGAEGSDFALTLLQRCLLAGRIVWFYLGKLLLPFDLIFIYPRWVVDAGVPWQWLFPLGLIAVLLAGWRLRAKMRAPLAVLLLFTGSLFPVLGFFNVYAFVFSFVADHWQYLPALAVIAAAAVLLGRAPFYVSALVAGALGVLSWQQSGRYADMDTFYRATLARNPDCWMAENNLGSVLKKAGRNDEAATHYEAALRIKPNSTKAHTNLGIILKERRQLREALGHFEAAVKFEPLDPVYQDNLAGTLRDVGRPAEAVPHHREAIRLGPYIAASHNNYGVTLRELGKQDEAIAQFDEAVRLDPDSAPAHLNLTLSYWQAGRTNEAKQHFLEARRLNPAIPDLDLDAKP